MGKTVFIVILIVAAVCALKAVFQRAAVGTQKDDQVAAMQHSGLSAQTDSKTINNEILSVATLEASKSNNAVAEDEKFISEKAATGKDQQIVTGLIAKNPNLNDGSMTVESFAVSTGDSDSSVELQKLRSEVSEDAPVEATILKEEENGEVTFLAADPEDYMLRLNDIVQNHQYTSTWDLLSLFRSELDSDNKESILSMSSLLPHDQNSALLLKMALFDPQSAEIREQAAALAADHPEQYLSLLMGHLTDSDPLVRGSIENAIILDIKPTTRVIGARSEPSLTASTPSLPN